MAQSLLPLHQMLQPNGCAASAASVTAVNAAHPSLLPSLIPSLSAAHQPHPSSSMANVAAAAGGPIHAHTPQHRFRYSPLAGAPLISTSAPMVSSAQTAGGAMALSAAGVNPLLASAVNPTALVTSMAHQQQQQQQQDYLALLQQQLLQQQLAAYAAAMATNPQQQQHQAMSSLSQMVAAQQQQQQQQYSAYAAALSAAGMASTTAAGQSAVAAVGTLNGFHHHQQSKSPSTNSSAAASGWTLSICNLAPETEESLLWKLFGPFGAVLSVQVLKGKGIGLVTMANYEEAYAAISGLNGQQLGGRTLQVAYSSNQAAAGAVTAAGLPSLLRS